MSERAGESTSPDRSEPPTVVLRRRGDRRLRRRHPWIFRGDVSEVRAEGGDVVRVLGHEGEPRGWALYSDESLIRLRMLTRREEPPDEGLWRRRLRRAIAYRQSFRIDSTAYRLVNAEADQLPSLKVDRYGDYLVIQTLSKGMERLRSTLIEHLVELLEPRGVLVRNDVGVRRLEGLEPEVAVAYGEVPERVRVREAGIVFEVDLRGGQKTGLYLDQRENRGAAARYARGRVLDGFCYQGGFGLRMAGLCERVFAVDSSVEALRAVRRNAELNGIDNVQACAANVFDLLRGFDKGGGSFDTIVLDPPPFAKNKSAIRKGLRAYKEINLRAMKLLAPGGHLITCSCSYHVGEDTFLDMLHDTASDVGCDLVVVEKRTQGRDHPILLGVPETHYLNCMILLKVE